jgi:hypothetical protein
LAFASIDEDSLKRFLYSRWFFLFLAVVCVLDLFSDVGEQIWGRDALNYVAIALDVIAVAMTLWIFIDIERRRATILIANDKDGIRTLIGTRHMFPSPHCEHHAGSRVPSFVLRPRLFWDLSRK